MNEARYIQKVGLYLIADDQFLFIQKKTSERKIKMHEWLNTWRMTTRVKKYLLDICLVRVIPEQGWYINASIIFLKV